MRAIRRTKRFKRDYKREKSGRHGKTLDAVLIPSCVNRASNNSRLPGGGKFSDLKMVLDLHASPSARSDARWTQWTWWTKLTSSGVHADAQRLTAQWVYHPHSALAGVLLAAVGFNLPVNLLRGAFQVELIEVLARGQDHVEV